MHQHDPYAPPQQAVHSAPISEFSIVGKQIRSANPLTLPTHICAKCGSEEPGGKVTSDKKVFWTPQWVWVTILLTWILTIILHFVLRKPLMLTFYTCPSCVGSKKKKMAISGAVMVAGIVMPIVAAAGMNDPSIVFLLGALMFVFGLVAVIIFAAPVLRPSKYDKTSMTFLIDGPKPAALARLAAHTSGSSDPAEAVW